VAPLAGLGAEMSIGHGCYLLLEAGAGPDFRTRAVQTTRLGLEGAFGFGYRVF
jgi:hypothetical protein